MRTFVSLPFEKLDELFTLIAQKEALYIPVDDASGKADFKRWKKGAVLSSELKTVRSAKDFFFPKIEKFSIVKTLDAIERANVVILMLDAHEGVSEQDAHLLGEITRRGRALIIAINKWDHLNDEQRQAIRSQF
ncbi:MAG: GTP-binding protein, partial [Treponema socranskii subsp. buccale]